MGIKVETDVLIVGSGPAGSSAALALSTYGIDNIVVTKYRWTANTPRAHITNQRAMEIFRDLEVVNDVREKATANHLMGDTVFCTSLAGEEFGRLKTWGTHPARHAEYRLASPELHVDMPQHLLEPILVGHAAARGSRVRFDTEYLCLEQDSAGVTATVRDRVSGEEYQIRAKYLIGADGGRSKVAKDIGLPMEGQMDLAGSMNIVFQADLSKYVAHRPSVLYWVLQPGSNIGGIGMGLIRMVRPWHEWLIVWGYDLDDPPEMNDELATQIAHNLIGDDSIPITILSTSLWTNNRMWAARYSMGRVFCMGDACHRHPPSNGLGSNTSIQDAYNLAWKLALVLKGKANPSLLETYDAERAPIGKQIVLRANESIEDTSEFFDALGLLTAGSPQQMQANIEKRKENSPQAAEQRKKLRNAMELKNYEFNTHGVEMGQLYQSAAVVGDGTPEPYDGRDRELYYQPTTWPGAHLPHCWVDYGGRAVSTLDLAGHGRFALFTSIGGEAWKEAAQDVSARTGVEIAAYIIGPGREVADLYDDWARLSEMEESGCVLVRPDGYIAWRSRTVVDNCMGKLGEVMYAILGNPQK